MADFGFGQGLMTGQKMMLAEREQENAALEADLKGKKLQLESAQMAQSMEMNRQKIAQDLFQQSVEMMKALHENVKMTPFVKPGSQVDQAIDKGKMILARNAERIGQDPGMAEVIAQAIRASAGTGIKPMIAQPGSSIVKPNAEGGVDTLHTQPQAPQQPTDLMQEAAFAFPGDRAKQQELVAGARTKSQASDATPLMKEAQALFPGDIEKQRTFIENSRSRPVAEVNLPAEKGETEAEKALGKVEGEEAGELLKERQRATASVERLQIVSSLAEQFKRQGGSFGALTTKKIEASKLMQSLGMKPEALGLPANVDAGEAIISMTNEMALGKIGGQGGMPANQFSEADREFLIQTVPNIENTERGFKTKMQIAGRVAQRKIEIANVFEEERAKGKTIAQAKSAAQKAIAEKPIFTEEEKKAIFGLTEKKDQVIDFSKMGDTEFLAADGKTMTTEQRKAWLAEFKRRRGQQ